MSRIAIIFTQVGAYLEGEPYRIGFIDVLILFMFSMATLAVIGSALALALGIGGAA